MNKKYFIILIAVMIFSLALAVQITNFDGYSTSENLTFTGDQNFTRNITIYRYANVTSAYMNLSGYPTIDLSGYTIVFEATSVNESAFVDDPINISNLSGGLWAVNSTDSIDIARAKILSLFFRPSDTLNASTSKAMTSITNLTRITSSESRDYDKKPIWNSHKLQHQVDEVAWANTTYYFNSTSGNEDVGFWARVWGTAYSGTGSSSVLLADDTQLVYGSSTSSYDFNTYNLNTTSNDTTNPTSVSFKTNTFGEAPGGIARVSALIMSSARLVNRTYSSNGLGAKTEHQFDYQINGSLPLFESPWFYPSNSYISINNTQIWNYSDNFDVSNNQTSDFASTLNTALNNGACDCTGCSLSGNNCTINFTFHSDTEGKLEYSAIDINWTESIYPTLTITEPTGTHTSVSNIPIDITASDDHRDTCWFNVTKGAVVEINNTIISDCSASNFSVSAFADYVFNACVNDTSGNENCSSSNFVVSTSVPSTGGGGGGSFIDKLLGKKGLGEESVCIQWRDQFREKWLERPEGDFNLDILWDIFQSFWDYIICKSASSIVPI